MFNMYSVSLVNFDSLFLPLEGVESRIDSFLKLPSVTRSFTCLIQGETSKTQEKSLVMLKKSSASFSLSDLEDDSHVKKAKDLPKTRALPLRSKNASKRKKVEEAIEISDFPILLDFHEAVKHSNMVMEQMVRSYNEKVQALEESENQLVIKDQIIGKDIEEMARLRKELSEKESTHIKKMEEVISEAKNSALIVVLEARIKMADEASKDGFDIFAWSVDCWKEKLSRLKGEDSEGAVVEYAKKVGDIILGDEGCDKKA